MITLHPAYILRRPDKEPELVADLRKAWKAANK
jgi:uracil-DNA glycosylase